MIELLSPDCHNCEMVDLDNPEFPCKLEEILRCSILNEFCKTEGIKRELYDF